MDDSWVITCHSTTIQRKVEIGQGGKNLYSVVQDLLPAVILAVFFYFEDS